MEAAFQVYVRVRPLTVKEQQTSKRGVQVLRVQDTCMWVTDARRELAYSFQDVYQEAASTEEVYQGAVALLVQNAWEGFNATCLAYGMTGAGKTHTMFGSMYLETAHQPGIVSLALSDLFSRVNSHRSGCQLRLSYLEIYNERTIDLLSSDPHKQPLLILDDPVKGIQVQNLQEVSITTEQQVQELVALGNSHRAKAATGANQLSTRSHAMLTITLVRRTRSIGAVETISGSKLTLIDLAGSERAANSDNRGLRMVEGANINRSLLALGTCINILSDPKQQGKYVPYRDSKLTRLLKESLGGNTRTVMIACISPSPAAIEETIHTLNYADRARKIEKKVVRNVQEVERHVSEYKEVIVSLQKEIESLKAQLQSKDVVVTPTNLQEERTKAVKEKKELSQELNKLSSQSSDQLSKELLNNFEEHWELKQSIQDIDSLNVQNKAKVKQLLTELEAVKAAGSKETVTTLKSDIVSTHQSIRENEESRNELVQRLYVRCDAAECQDEIQTAKELKRTNGREKARSRRVGNSAPDTET